MHEQPVPHDAPLHDGSAQSVMPSQSLSRPSLHEVSAGWVAAPAMKGVAAVQASSRFMPITHRQPAPHETPLHDESAQSLMPSQSLSKPSVHDVSPPGWGVPPLPVHAHTIAMHTKPFARHVMPLQVSSAQS